MKFKAPKTQNEVQTDDKLMWESFVSREDSEEYDPKKSPWYKDDPENDANIARDKHSQNLQTIKPLDELAKKYGADDIIDWLAQGIKDQGQNWIDDFEERNMIEM